MTRSTVVQASPDGSGALQRTVINTPWYYGWNVIAVAAIYDGIVWGLGVHCFTYFVNDWTETFKVGRGDVMLAISLAVVIIGASAPFAGRLVDRVSMTLLLTAALVTFSAGMLLISMATELWQIIAVYGGLLAVSMTFLGPLSITTLAVRWFRARRGLALAVVLAGGSIWAILLPPLITGWIAEYGWRTTYVYMALMCLALAPLVLWIVRGSPESAGVEIEADNPRTAAQAIEHHGKTWKIMDVLRSPSLWLIVVAFIPLAMLNLGVTTNIAPFAKDLDFSLKQATALIPVMGAASLSAKFFFGALADRTDSRFLFFIAVACVAAGMAVMFLAPGFELMLVACGLFSFGEGAALLLIGSIVAARFGPGAYGTAIGIAYFFIMTLAALGPVLGGYLRDITGSYSAMFAVMLMMLVPAVVAMWFLRGPIQAPGSHARSETEPDGVASAPGAGSAGI